VYAYLRIGARDAHFLMQWLAHMWQFGIFYKDTLVVEDEHSRHVERPPWRRPLCTWKLGMGP
jgi:hypothetical protein